MSQTSNLKENIFLITNLVLIIGIILMVYLILDSLPKGEIDSRKRTNLLKIEVLDPKPQELLPDTFVFNDFELGNAINNLLDIEKNVDVSLSREWQTGGDHSARVEFDSTRYCEIGINYTPPWWHLYDSLCFDLYFAEGRITSVSFRIGDYYTPKSYCDSCQKFRKSTAFRKGINRFCFSIREIESLIDIDSRFKSLHLGFMPKSSGHFLIDRFRLVRYAEE